MNRNKQKCGNCSAFVIYNNGPLGSCRANAPVVMQGLQKTALQPNPVQVVQGVFPPTSAEEWCRQWQSAVDFDIEALQPRGN
jgi:hypothetical protein